MWGRRPASVHASSHRCLVLGFVPGLGALLVHSSRNRDLFGQILMLRFFLVMSLLFWSEWEVEERSTARGNKTSCCCHPLRWREDTLGHPLVDLGGEGTTQATMSSFDSHRWLGDLQILQVRDVGLPTASRAGEGARREPLFCADLELWREVTQMLRLLRRQRLLWTGYGNLVSSSAIVTTSRAVGFMVTSKIQSILLNWWRDRFFGFYKLRRICSSLQPPAGGPHHLAHRQQGRGRRWW
jgi:hypothetical protein